jgi:hypothetical protein
MISDPLLHPTLGRERPGSGAAAAALIVLTAIVAAISGCVATSPQGEVREYLDEQTAATVTVLGRPIVFAMERPQLAVHARDYLTLVPIDVNRAGAHKRYYYGYAWSTIDKRGFSGAEEPPARYELVADGRRIPLVPLAGQPRDLGLGEAPIPPPNATAVRMIAGTTAEVQDFVSRAEDIVAVAAREGGGDRFALWAR